MSTQVADPLLGSLIDGRYRVRSRVARGGMATVYAATDERLERTVALKIVHPTQAVEPEFIDRFGDEARAIARLTHPNVVGVYDQGVHNGLPYLVMEYVNGRTLREVLGRRRRLTPVEALAIVEQMLAAIAAAHRAGLVHRDVKPENVLIAAPPSAREGDLVDSVAKVADFGLAQAVRASTATDAHGTVLATVAYVPPEVLTDHRADPRSDVYSTGIVLFEMLTGRVPFDGADATKVAWQHVDQDVPAPSRYLPDLPAAVDDLVVWATRRDPALRPTDAAAMLTKVQAVREQLATRVAPPAPDATVVMSQVPAQVSPVPGSPGRVGPRPASPTGERPSWARLPSDRTGTRYRAAAAGRPESVRRSDAGGRGARSGQSGSLLATPGRRQAVAAVALVIGLLVAVGGWWFGLGRWTPAPQLVGDPQEQAVAEARAAGLTVEFSAPRHDDTVPADHVLAQDPSDRVRKGGTITLTLSLGPKVFDVPDVVGAQVDVAIRQLQELGLVVERGAEVFSDTVPEGRVATVSPDIGEQARAGDTVTVAVSKGRSPLRVPLLVGKPQQQAVDELRQLGLVAAVEQVESDEPAGEVVGQSPEYDTGTEAGATVTIEVSKGPPTRPVPEVRNRRCQEAIQALERDGFRAGLPTGDRGRVFFQNPSPGTGLPPGSEVTIWCL